MPRGKMLYYQGQGVKQAQANAQDLYKACAEAGILMPMAAGATIPQEWRNSYPITFLWYCGAGCHGHQNTSFSTGFVQILWKPAAFFPSFRLGKKAAGFHKICTKPVLKLVF
jgi:hypothetical protein